jgi:molybdate-binding protein
MLQLYRKCRIVNREKRREVRRLAKLELLKSINNSNAVYGNYSNVTSGETPAAAASSSGAAAAAAAAAPAAGAVGGGYTTTTAAFSPPVSNYFYYICCHSLICWLASSGYCMLL